MKVIYLLSLAWWIGLSQSFPCFVEQMISHEPWKTYATCILFVFINWKNITISSSSYSSIINWKPFWSFLNIEASQLPFYCKFLVLFWVYVLTCFIHVWLFATLWAAAHQVPLSLGILHVSILEWVSMPSSRGSSRPRDQTHISYVSCIGRWLLTTSITCLS